MRIATALVLSALLWTPVHAQDDDAPAPQVTIEKKGDKTVEEYRLHGHLYMIKVTPSMGPSYYLVDINGDGELNERRDELAPDFAIPSWVLIKW